MGQTTRLVIFTDLDGSLLDTETYRFDAARAALEELTARQVPLVLCTSKTRAEVEPLRQELGITDPFIVENGGASIFLARTFLRCPPALHNEATIMSFNSGPPIHGYERGFARWRTK
ncbi:MAG: HAD hydrolase family protein [Nitrospirales bacterium]